MKLTNGDAWHTFAGGTSAASDTNSYSAYATIGRYLINPISHKHNVEHHLGYRVWFLNELGRLDGGLWQAIHNLTDLLSARRLCQAHMEANNGELVPEQIPGAMAEIDELIGTID